MKYIITVSFCSFILFLSKRSSEKNYPTVIITNDSTPSRKNKKELNFDYPDEITTDTGRVSFLKRFKRGKAIYIETCAKCHDSTKNGKVFYPDFSLPQLMDYEMRFQYPAHSEDLNETNITVDELDDVVDFLRYKKKNLVK
jgi:hypothetical protein